MKTTTPKEMSDFRPIALLCSLSKPLERLVHTVTVEHLTRQNFFDEYQSGVRKHYGTQSALIKVTDDIRRSIEARKVTVLVQFDLSKAFDSVDHGILLERMSQLKFSYSTLLWYRSYLSNRQQAVKDEDDNVSLFQPVLRGVPQGSTLGPLLFSIYIKELSNVIAHCKYHFYADDLQIYLESHQSEINRAITLVNMDIQSICDWLSENRLKLNPNKTKSIIFGSAPTVHTVLSSGLPKINVLNIPIDYSCTVKSLGVYLSSALTWREHVNAISNRVHKTLYRMKYFRHLIPVKLRQRLVLTLVFPHFDYCSVIYSDMNKELSTKLQRLQNSCLRYIFNIRYDEHVTPYYKNLNWLKLEQRRTVQKVVQLYKIINTKTPSYLYIHFTFNAQMIKRSTRITKTFHIPKYRTIKYENSFHISSCKLWNNLPNHIKSSKSIVQLKRNMTDYLLSLQS
jgi:hypothetical protein